MLKKVKRKNFINPTILMQYLIIGLISASIAATDPGTPLGFASLNGGTTGGKDGEVVKVSGKNDFAAAVAGNDKKIIEVSGSFNLDKGKFVDVGSNKTIIGTGNAKIQYGGIQLNGSKNVIIKNIEFHNPDGKSDNIYIFNGSENIWIDHCTFSGDPVESHDKLHDHTIDIRDGSRYITISYCEFHNFCQNVMIGADNNNGEIDKKIKITFHHNWFNGTQSRNPRIRFATVHLFNNAYNDNNWRSAKEAEQGFGVLSTCEAKVVVESCHFTNTLNPVVIKFMTNPEGEMVEKNNIYEKSGTPKSGGTAFDPSAEYPYTCDNASDIPSIVKEYTGAGKPDRVITKAVTHRNDATKDNLSISIINSNRLVINSTSTDNVTAGTFTIYAVSGKTIAEYDFANQNTGKTVSFNLPEKLGAGNYYYRFVNKNSSFTGLLQYMQQP